MAAALTVLAITLDLDDTLWPIWPVIERAEHVLHDWLLANAPATAAAHDVAALRALRAEIARLRPEWAHDLTALRLESIRRALHVSGDDPALADAAFEVFFAARHEVQLFDEVPAALEALAARYPLIALTNGNADLMRTGVARYFKGRLTARQFGAAKPDAAIFHEACRLAGCSPARVLHVGDDAVMDVDGALDAGLRAGWMRRPGIGTDVAPKGTPHHVLAHLGELVDALA